MADTDLARDVEIARLEFEVCEAAVRFRKAETAVWVESEVGTNDSAAQAKAERPRAYIALVDAVDALITARRKVENQVLSHVHNWHSGINLDVNPPVQMRQCPCGASEEVRTTLSP